MTMTDFAHTDRIGKLHSPEGLDELLLLRFLGSDGVDEMFEYEVEAISQDPDLDFDTLLGEHVTVELETIADGPTYFDGIVTEGSWAGVGETGHIYNLTLRPWLYVASKRRNQRIFHDKTAPDIIKEVFQDHSTDFEDRLRGSYETLEYTVQYSESDQHFVCRLMERYGINYFFTHEQGKHTLVMVDDMGGYDTVPGGEREHVMVDRQHGDDKEHFWNWIPRRSFTTGKVKLNDYYFKTPSSKLVGEYTGDAAYTNPEVEAYDYPGNYRTAGNGKTLAQIRTEQERSADKHHSASGDTMAIKSGMLLTLTSDLEARIYGEEYLCLRASHSFVSEAYGSGQSLDEEHAFVGNYDFFPKDVPYAPPRKTYETRVQGPQTAVVVTENAGEEIDVDKYGRILVKFHWDLPGDNSMRVRVSQLWAQKQWGAVFTPRVGMEVIVIFIEGDPDRPMVTGCVYNEENMPPYPLPDEKNWNGIKSNSTKGGGGYNELVFNDTAGEELFRQHAQFDMETLVLNDERRTIENDRTTDIANDETKNVGNDEALTVGNNQTEDVGSNRDTTIGSNDTLDVGQTLKITAGMKIELVVGGSKIVMTPDKIEISALQIDVKAAAALNTQGVMATHKADGIMTVQGSLVKIN